MENQIAWGFANKIADYWEENKYKMDVKNLPEIKTIYPDGEKDLKNTIREAVYVCLRELEVQYVLEIKNKYFGV